MKTTIIEYLLLLLVLLALFSISIALEVNLYPYLSAITPFVWYISKQQNNTISFILFTLTLLIVINMEYLLFVDYMNKPWFAGEDPFTCDGPCYGWYTYEHNINFEIITNISLQVTSSLILLLIKILSLRKKDH
jgi:hypothetical protein